jgi:hypothetical protein
VTVTTCGNGACCGYFFETGQAYVVYATGEGKALDVSLCSRTRPLADNADEVIALNAATAKPKS